MLHGITASGFSVFAPLSEIIGYVPGAGRNETYSTTLSVTGGKPPYTWSIVSGSLPDGLSIDPDTGEISGVVPNSEDPGYYTFTVQVESADGQVRQKEFTMGIGVYVVILHGDGTDGSSTITDATGRTWTRSGDAQIDTSQFVFGGASIFFDGTGDFVSTADAAALEFGSNDFTVRCRVRFAAVSGTTKVIASKRTMGSNGEWSLLLNPTNVLGFIAWNSANTIICNISGTTTISANTWYDVEVGRKGGTVYLIIDGVLEASGAISGTIGNNSATLKLASDAIDASRNLNGWVDEFHILTGAALNIAARPTPNSATDYPVVP